MTLPFRRRHHDSEGTHDRARSLTSRQMLEPLDASESTWLANHLDDCAECRRDREAYLADRDLLRSLRDAPPEPPRDLWARTSSALDREARHRRRGPATAADAHPGGSRWRGLPLSAAAGALIVAVVIGVSMVPRALPSGSPAPNGGSGFAVASPQAVPTSIALVAAANLSWIQAQPDGSWALVDADVDEVCPRAKANCRLDPSGPARRVNLGTSPAGVTISPKSDQLVVVSPGDGVTPDRIIVVPVPASGDGPTAAPVSPSADVSPTAPTQAPGTPTVPASGGPATAGPPTSEPSAGPTPAATPAGQVEIASGVVVVGEAAYSPDGRWLAFSARPSDGSTGPDLYLWAVGDGAARAVTTDHATYFSAWYGDDVLASQVLVPGGPVPSQDPGASAGPSAGPTPAGEPTSEPTGDPTRSGEPSPSAGSAGEAHPVSFLLDPATLGRTDLAQPDVWLPVVDPTGRFATYWSGTLQPTEDGTDWQLGTGQLVLDGWTEALSGAVDPDASATPAISLVPSIDPNASLDPNVSIDPNASPAPVVGPAGTPTPLVSGPAAAFKARFDPDGTRLGIWVAEQPDATVGRLTLVVLDPETGAIDTTKAPLPGAPALRRFSVDEGRVAWVSPRGQDGKESAVQVLGWLGDEFGEITTVPGRDLYIVR